ncbi:MAG: type I methionyl aminopeptidase [Patescibacteria group bacterium]
MIRIKTAEEIEKMKSGGVILSRVLSLLVKNCVAGANTEDLDRLAQEEIKKAGGEPSFLNYQIHSSDPPYPSAVCISINDEVVHGPATPNRVIKDGDVVKLDIGLWYEGMATDMACTVLVGNVPEIARELSADTRKSLEMALETVHEGSWLHAIGKTIQDCLEPKGYGIVRDLVGHGVGYKVHEEPQIPHFHDRRLPPVKLKAGMCLAIEPMVAAGDWRVKQKDDGWTIITADGSLAAHWEVTICVTHDGYELITPWPTT